MSALFIHPIQRLGRAGINAISRLGAMVVFLVQAASGMLRILGRPRMIVQQLYYVGVQTTLIIVVAGFFVGMVLGLQGYLQLSRFAAESSLGMGVALTLVRELGPVVTALLFAGRAGSALTAEIGLMKTTEQLAAMEMMAVNPMHRVVGPRFWAGIIALPVLAAMFSAVGIFGAHLIGVVQFGIDAGEFWSAMQASVDFRTDVLNGMIKAVVFGAVVTWIALFEGYHAAPTSAGVSRATTHTVVTASLTVLALDYLLTALMFSGI